MSAPDTYRVFIPATGKTIDFGSRGSAAISEWGILRKMGKDPEFLCPGIELKVGCLLTDGQPKTSVEQQ